MVDVNNNKQVAPFVLSPKCPYAPYANATLLVQLLHPVDTQFTVTSWKGYEKRLFYETKLIDNTLDTYISDLFARCDQTNIVVWCCSRNNANTYAIVGAAIQRCINKSPKSNYGSVVVVHEARNVIEVIPVFKELGNVANVVRSNDTLFVKGIDHLNNKNSLFDCYNKLVLQAACVTNRRNKQTSYIHTDPFYHIKVDIDTDCHRLFSVHQPPAVREMFARSQVEICVIYDLQSTPLDITKQKWFKQYVKIKPVCAKGRLIQYTGTCWLNTSLNIILLTPALAKRAKENFLKENTGKTDEELGNEFNMDTCIMKIRENVANEQNTRVTKRAMDMLVYNILIKGRKAARTNGNFLRPVGRAMKKIGKHIGGDGNNACVNLEYINVNNDYNKAVDQGYFPEPVLLNILIPMLFGDDMVVVNSENDLRKIKTTPTIACIDSKCNTFMSRSVIINGTTYELQAAAIYVNDDHVIAGLMCGEDSYVFDSHNYLAYCDWPNHEFSMYESMQPLKKGNKVCTDEQYPSPKFVIYVRVDPQ